MEQINEKRAKRKAQSNDEIIEVNKTINEEMKTLEKSEEEVLPPEQKILMLSCLNPSVLSSIKKLANKNKMEIVYLDEKIIWDYIEANKTSTAGDSLQNFLSTVENRSKAKEHAVHLWQILTGGDDFSNAEKRIFKRTDITRNTNLSHSKANNLLQLLFTFGYVEYVNKDFEFKFIFDEALQRKTLQAGIQSVCNVVFSDFVKYKTLVEQSETLSSEQKQEEINNMKDKIRKQIGI